MVQSLIDDLLERDPSFTDHLIQRLKRAVGNQSQQLWRVNLSANEATAAYEHLAEKKLLMLGDILKDPCNSEKSLSCVALMINRDGHFKMLPEDSEALMPGDEILFCGTRRCKQLLSAVLNNPYTLHYLITGNDLPRGYFFSWLTNKLALRS